MRNKEIRSILMDGVYVLDVLQEYNTSANWKANLNTVNGDAKERYKLEKPLLDLRFSRSIQQRRVLRLQALLNENGDRVVC
ncbi:hypothetical protein CTI12_AA397010 [Artemisia annua]|uniref:Uncharacterized protein n=1 Tax=Artemisia annua TaxID=35608 RepID=A0A2U1MBW5_ARTAN|nr:hypothetical protein CTI12_AA397010 [Artemisia annua]